MTARATQRVYCFNHRMLNLSLQQVQKLQILWPWVCRKPVSDVRGSVLCPTGGGEQEGLLGDLHLQMVEVPTRKQMNKMDSGRESGRNSEAAVTQRFFSFQSMEPFRKYQYTQATKHNKQTIRIQSQRLMCQIPEKHNGLFPLCLQSRWLRNTLKAVIYYFQSPFCEQTKPKHNSYQKSRHPCCYGFSHVLIVNRALMDKEVMQLQSQMLPLVQPGSISTPLLRPFKALLLYLQSLKTDSKSSRKQ